MSTDNTIFKKIFGDEIGEMLQVVLGIGFMMGLFIGGPLLISKCASNSKDKDYKEIVTGSRQTTQNIYIQLHHYDSLTQVIDNNINTELLKEKELINKKKIILIELSKDFDSIYLTPQQLKLLESVSDVNHDIAFKDWISSSNQWYNICLLYTSPSPRDS